MTIGYHYHCLQRHELITITLPGNLCMLVVAWWWVGGAIPHSPAHSCVAEIRERVQGDSPRVIHNAVVAKGRPPHQNAVVAKGPLPAKMQ